jgi:hypothetical protein
VYDVVAAIESIGGMGLGIMREVLEDDLEREEGRLLFDGMDRLAGECTIITLDSFRLHFCHTHCS